MVCKKTCKLLIILSFIIPLKVPAQTRLEQLIQIKTTEEWISTVPAGNKALSPLLRCKEELSLGLVPVTCFESSLLTPDTAAFLNRQCHEAVRNIESLRVLGQLIHNSNISELCRAKIRERGMIVAYKLEDQRPSEAFEFFSHNFGTNLVNQIGHAQRTAN